MKKPVKDMSMQEIKDELWELMGPNHALDIRQHALETLRDKCLPQMIDDAKANHLPLLVNTLEAELKIVQSME